MQLKPFYFPVLIFVAVFAFFIHNEEMQEGIMEIRNFVTAREIVQSGDWMVPTMNGELRLEKPPLPTWIAAAVYAIDGNNLLLQRVPAGCAAIMIIIYFFFFVYRFTGDGETAFLSTLILLSSFYMVLMGRTATWDIYCHCFMMAAMLAMYNAITMPGSQWGRFCVAGIMMGVSYLSKGPVAFHALLIPFILAWVITKGASMQGKWKQVVVMVVLLSIVGFWWTVYLHLFEPEKMATAMNKEINSWGSHGVKPWWYYWNFFLQTGAWAVPALLGLFYPLWKKYAVNKKHYLFAVLWSLFVLVLLSVVPKKDTRYLFPMLIPLSMCIGLLVKAQLQRKDSYALRVVFNISYSIVALVAFALPGVLWYAYSQGVVNAYTASLTGLATVAIGIYMIRGMYKKMPKTGVYGVVLLMIVVEGMLPAPINSFFKGDETLGLQQLRKNATYYKMPYYYLQQNPLRIELVYYADKKILPLDTVNIPETPFIVVTNAPIENVDNGLLQNNYKLTPVGRYDNNMKGKKRDIFISYVTMIEKKEEE
ncbi:MAG: ArnT family glycosyltransferase [Marinifilaceae bacterium]